MSRKENVNKPLSGQPQLLDQPKAQQSDNTVGRGMFFEERVKSKNETWFQLTWNYHHKSAN